MLRVFVSLVVVLAAGIAKAEADPRPMSPIDFIEMPRLSDPALSPDGAFLAYAQSETVWADNRIVDRLHLIDVSTGEALPVPDFGGPLANASKVWWHPSEHRFIYLKKTGNADKHQAHLYDLSTQENVQLTNHGEAVLDVIWAKDGLGFFFIAAEQQPQGDNQLLSEGWVIPPFESNADREVWYFDLAAQQAEPIISGRSSVRQVSLSDNGRYLTFARVPDHRLDTTFLGEVLVHDLETGESVRRTGNRYAELLPKIAPDGLHLAYIASVGERGEPYYEPKVFIAHPQKPTQRLLKDMGMEALDFAWDASGEGLYIVGNTGLSADLYHYTLETGALIRLTRGAHSIKSWSYNAATETHIAQFETAKDPGEIYVMRDREIGFESVTSVYSDWAATFQLPRQERVTWRGRRGAQLEGVLVYPVGYKEGKRYPLVTITHGGPRNSSKFGSWQVSRSVPVFAGQGYMVFLPNHRGGTGYGDRFVRDMYGAYFRNAHHDVMDGIDALIDRGLADRDKLIKMGWSAGGHMVNKLITHTDRFAAASSGAGASDWRSMHGESDVRYSRQFVFGGAPWMRNAPNRQYDRDSPLKDAWKVTTPTLFFVGENDVRVPPTQSILMFRGVEATGTPTILFQAEDEPHNFQRPGNQLFKMNTELRWYARFALGERYEPMLPDAAYQAPPAGPDQTDSPAHITGASSP